MSLHKITKRCVGLWMKHYSNLLYFNLGKSSYYFVAGSSQLVYHVITTLEEIEDDLDTPGDESADI